MEHIEEYQDTRLGKKLIESIRLSSRRQIRLMDFCSSHTVAIFKHGIRRLLPPTIEMLSGPGCPVCVTSVQDVDRVIALSALTGVTVATFGDLVRAPGTVSSLQQARAEGRDIRTVHSALEALDLARKDPAKKVVLAGIGFETAAPTVAASILQAQEENLTNYFVLSLHKLTPPSIRAVLEGAPRIDGILCPGHVSSIIGSTPYQFIVKDYGIGCVVAGFEPMDILLSISMLVKQAENKKPGVEIVYSRAVRPEGNQEAIRLMVQVFEAAPALWRGLGNVANSGLKIRDEFARFDAERIFNIPPQDSREKAECLCGDIVRGAKIPLDCRLFGQTCTPAGPVGPCMASAEGTCAVYYRYGEKTLG